MTPPAALSFDIFSVAGRAMALGIAFLATVVNPSLAQDCGFELRSLKGVTKGMTLDEIEKALGCPGGRIIRSEQELRMMEEAGKRDGSWPLPKGHEFVSWRSRRCLAVTVVKFVDGIAVEIVTGAEGRTPCADQ